MITALTLGGITPSAIPKEFYNALIITFSLSIAVAFATTVALIPAPSDLRIPRRYRDQDDSDDDTPEDKPIERFTGYSHPVFTRPLPEPKDR